jgi:beta-lactamase class A
MEDRIRGVEAAFSGRLGAAAFHVQSHETFELRADELFPTASVIKLGLACAYLDLVRRGAADLDEMLRLPPREARVTGGGILKQLDVETLSARDVLELTITLSDNVATNVLLDRAGGADAVNTYLAEAGFSSTRILGPVDFAAITHDVAGGIGVSTPREQMLILLALARETILTPELCRLLLAVLRRQHHQDQLPRWLGWNPYAQYHGREQVLAVANKTGELDGVRADAGLIAHREHGTLAVAVFTDQGSDRRETVDVEGTLAVAEVSAALAAGLLGLDC